MTDEKVDKEKKEIREKIRKMRSKLPKAECCQKAWRSRSGFSAYLNSGAQKLYLSTFQREMRYRPSK